jgi:cell division protein FtsW
MQFIERKKNWYKNLNQPSNKFNNWFKKIILPSQSYKIDWYLIVLLIILLVSGLTFLASALTGIRTNGNGTESILGIYQVEFIKQIFFGIWLGGGCCFFLSRLDYHKIFKLDKILIGITLLSLAFLTFFIIYSLVTGQRLLDIINSIQWMPIKPYWANQSIRWIDIIFLPNFQPTEFAKLTLLIYLASKLNRIKSQQNINWQVLKNPLWIFLLCATMILLQPDLGSVVIIGSILFGALWIVKTPIKILLILVGVGIIFTTLLTVSYGYRLNRVTTFIDILNNSATACNKENIQGSNFQVCQARIALSSGGLWGKGYGNASSKINGNVPELATDGILAIIGEEMGYVGIVFILSLYILIFFRGLKITNNAPDIGGQALAGGISIWLVAQAFSNIAGITGLLPLKGAPLPFISQGGSALIFNLCAIGILLNISSQQITTQKIR